MSKMIQTSRYITRSAMLEAKVAKGDADDRIRKFVASTDTIDGDGEIVAQNFDLKRFKANPVVLFAHDSRELPIGKAVEVGVEDGKLKASIQFATAEMNPKAEQVLQLLDAGMLNAVSIGFMPKEVRLEKRDDKDVYVLDNNELFEISVTPVQSNPEALQEAKMKAMAAAKPNDNPTPSEESTKESADCGEEKQMNEKAFADLQEQYKAMEARHSATEEALKESRAEVVKLTTDKYSKQLDELIGKKIAPNEKASLLKMAEVDQEVFLEHLEAIKARPDMKLIDGSGIKHDAPEQKLLPSGADSGESGADFESFVSQAAGIN